MREWGSLKFKETRQIIRRAVDW